METLVELRWMRARIETGPWSEIPTMGRLAQWVIDNQPPTIFVPACPDIEVMFGPDACGLFLNLRAESEASALDALRDALADCPVRVTSIDVQLTGGVGWV
jgi:hypothetical protein